MTTLNHSAAEALFGNRVLTERAPSTSFPQHETGRTDAMRPAYTLPPDAENVKIVRALVKETMSREQVERLTRDIADACATDELVTFAKARGVGLGSAFLRSRILPHQGADNTQAVYTLERYEPIAKFNHLRQIGATRLKNRWLAVRGRACSPDEAYVLDGRSSSGKPGAERSAAYRGMDQAPWRLGVGGLVHEQCQQGARVQRLHRRPGTVPRSRAVRHRCDHGDVTA